MLGDDDDGGNGWWWRNSPQNAGLPLGLNRFFAVAENDFAQRGNIVQTEVTTHAIDTTPPEAVAQANDVTAEGTFHEFQVTYTDNIAVRTHDFGDTDIRVIGPNDLWAQDAEFITADDFSNGPVRVATYRIPARGGNWDGFDNGEYRIFLKNQQIVDTNGNFVAMGVIGTFDVAVPFDDSTPPVVTLDALSTDLNHPTPNASQYISITGTASDPESGIIPDSYEFSYKRFDGNAWTPWTDVPENDGQTSLGPLAEGLYAIYLSAINGAGIAGQSLVHYFEVDTVRPTPPTVTGLSIDTGASTSDGITNDPVPTFSWTESGDSGSGVAGYWWSVDDSTPETGGVFTSARAATQLVSINGAHTFYVRAQDGVGNRSSVSSFSFTLDRVAPEVATMVPGNGSTVAAGPSFILVDFSESMDPSSLSASALTLTGPGAGSATVQSANWVDENTARFTIGGQWGTGLVSGTMITGELRDLAGNTLRDFTDWEFMIDEAVLPEIVVSTSGGVEIQNGNYTLDLGSVMQGDAAPSATFTVRNTGTGTLTLEPISVPPGFTVSDQLVGNLGPNESDTFAVQLDTLTPGSHSGHLSFANNDTDESPFGFEVHGQVNQPPVEFAWAKSVSGTSYVIPSDLAVDSTGNIYVTGYFNGAADFDPGPGETLLTSSFNDRSIFIAKYSSTGGLVWANEYGSDSSKDYGRAIAVGPGGNVFVTGWYGDPIDFGGTVLPENNNGDIFVVKLNSSGTVLWATGMGGPSYDAGEGIDVDASGDVYVVGHFEETVNFGGHARTASGFEDAFLMKLNGSSGSVSWVRVMGGTKPERAYDVSVDQNGVYTTGYFMETVNFNRDGTAVYETSNGGYDMFATKHSHSGAFAWVQTAGGISDERLGALKPDPMAVST